MLAVNVLFQGVTNFGDVITVVAHELFVAIAIVSQQDEFRECFERTAFFTLVFCYVTLVCFSQSFQVFDIHVFENIYFKVCLIVAFFAFVHFLSTGNTCEYVVYLVVAVQMVFDCEVPWGHVGAKLTLV